LWISRLQTKLRSSLSLWAIGLIIFARPNRASNKNVSDCKIIFAALVGKDSKDATTVSLPPAAPLKDLKSVKIGLPKEYFVEGTDGAIKNQLENL